MYAYLTTNKTQCLQVKHSGKRGVEEALAQIGIPNESLYLYDIYQETVAHQLRGRVWTSKKTGYWIVENKLRGFKLKMQLFSNHDPRYTIKKVEV